MSTLILQWVSYDPTTNWTYREVLKDREIYELLRQKELEKKGVRQ